MANGTEWRNVLLISLIVVTVMRFNGISQDSSTASSSGITSIDVPAKIRYARKTAPHVTSDGRSHAAKHRQEIPEIYANLLETDSTDVRAKDYVPLFWHIPRAGGSSIKNLMGYCLGLTQASGIGGNERAHVTEGQLMVVRLSEQKFVNVDTSTPAGIERAKNMYLAESGLADVVSTGLIQTSTTLFGGEKKGRMFAMFRHPIDRAVSLFYYINKDKWATQDSKQSTQELKEFLSTPSVENNWVTRMLIGRMSGKLYLEDLDQAKEILRRKCLIGLLDRKDESIQRFEKFFGWEERAGMPGVRQCEEKLMNWGWINKNKHPAVEEGSPQYELLVLKNEFDMELYEYAKELFEEQSVLFINDEEEEEVKVEDEKPDEEKDDEEGVEEDEKEGEEEVNEEEKKDDAEGEETEDDGKTEEEKVEGEEARRVLKGHRGAE